jgi:hypothetical protein
VPGPTAAGATAPAGGSDLLRQLAEPFLRLPAADSDRLALLLGAAYSDRRRVVVPLGLLQLLCCWLLLSGALATLRRQGWGPSMWSFAAWAGIGFALLHTLVAFVDSRNLMARLGPPAAAALAQANSISVDQAMSHLWQLARLGVVFRAAIEGVWVLLLGLSALYIRRWLPHKRAPILPSRDRRGRPRSAR